MNSRDCHVRSSRAPLSEVTQRCNCLIRRRNVAATLNTGSNLVGATEVNSLAFCDPGFRNIRMFLEPGPWAQPHSVNIRSAFSS